MDILGQVQHWAAKIMEGLEHLSCEETLRELGLFGLEGKRCSDTYIHMYKYLTEEKEGIRLFRSAH